MTKSDFHLGVRVCLIVLLTVWTSLWAHDMYPSNPTWYSPIGMYMFASIPIFYLLFQHWRDQDDKKAEWLARFISSGNLLFCLWVYPLLIILPAIFLLLSNGVLEATLDTLMGGLLMLALSWSIAEWTHRAYAPYMDAAPKEKRKNDDLCTS